MDLVARLSPSFSHPRAIESAQCWVFSSHNDAKIHALSVRAGLRRGSGVNIKVLARSIRAGSLTVYVYLVVKSKRAPKSPPPTTHTVLNPGAPGVVQS